MIRNNIEMYEDEFLFLLKIIQCLLDSFKNGNSFLFIDFVLLPFNCDENKTLDFFGYNLFFLVYLHNNFHICKKICNEKKELLNFLFDLEARTPDCCRNYCQNDLFHSVHLLEMLSKIFMF